MRTLGNVICFQLVVMDAMSYYILNQILSVFEDTFLFRIKFIIVLITVLKVIL